MEIQGKELNMEADFLGPVTYIPSHANGNASHPDCEQGVIVYCKGRTVQATNPSDLVWG